MNTNRIDTAMTELFGDALPTEVPREIVEWNMPDRLEAAFDKMEASLELFTSDVAYLQAVVDAADEAKHRRNRASTRKSNALRRDCE